MRFAMLKWKKKFNGGIVHCLKRQKVGLYSSSACTVVCVCVFVREDAACIYELDVFFFNLQCALVYNCEQM